MNTGGSAAKANPTKQRRERNPKIWGGQRLVRADVVVAGVPFNAETQRTRRNATVRAKRRRRDQIVAPGVSPGSRCRTLEPRQGRQKFCRPCRGFGHNRPLPRAHARGYCLLALRALFCDGKQAARVSNTPNWLPIFVRHKSLGSPAAPRALWSAASSRRFPQATCRRGGMRWPFAQVRRRAGASRRALDIADAS